MVLTARNDYGAFMHLGNYSLAGCCNDKYARLVLHSATTDTAVPCLTHSHCMSLGANMHQSMPCSGTLCNNRNHQSYRASQLHASVLLKGNAYLFGGQNVCTLDVTVYHTLVMQIG